MSPLFSTFFGKLMLLTLLLSLIPLIIVGTILYLNEIDTKIITLRNELVSISQSGAQNISNWISEKKTNVETISKNDEIITGTKILLDPKATAEDKFNAQFMLEKRTSVLSDTYSWLNEIIISEPKSGKVIFYTGIRPPKDTLFEEKYLATATKETVLKDIFLSNDLVKNEIGQYDVQVPTLLISTPIKGEVGIVGILTARIDVFKINADVMSHHGDFSTQNVYFINSDGFMLSKPNISQTINAKQRPELDISLVDPRSKEPVKILQQAQKDKTSWNLDGYTSYLGNNVIGSITPIMNTPWYYVAEIDKNEAFADISTTQVLLTTSIIVILIVIVSVSYYFSKHLVRPIYNLRIATKKIQEGNLDIKIPVSGNDETSELATSFAEMVESLKKSRSLHVAAESKYRNLYDDAPVLLRTINSAGIIIDCNKLYAKRLDYTKDEIIGKSIFDHVDIKYTEAMKNSFETWKKTGAVSNREIWLKTKNGETFPTILTANNLHDEKGNIIGSNTVIRDISEIYDAKQEIERQKMKKMSVVGELSARIAHDLRNPLVVIKNVVQLMQLKNSLVGEKNNEYLSKIDRAILRMTHMIDEVLDYVSPKPLNLGETSVLETLLTTRERLQIPENVIVNLPQNDAVLIHDQEKLEIVFINLMTNAIQEMTKTGGRLDVRIVETDQEILVEFEDTGRGMPPEVLEKIFEPLFTTKQTGTGLGLVSCKSIIEKHNGRIEAQSVVNRGSVFTIRFPKNIKNNVIKQN